MPAVHVADMRHDPKHISSIDIPNTLCYPTRQMLQSPAGAGTQSAPDSMKNSFLCSSSPLYLYT